MKKKTIKVLLKPKDFINVSFCSNSDCAVSRAIKRKLKEPFVSVDTETVDILFTEIGTKTKKTYVIKDNFSAEDFHFIQAKYAKDPKMKKAKYYVTLIEQ